MSDAKVVSKDEITSADNGASPMTLAARPSNGLPPTARWLKATSYGMLAAGLIAAVSVGSGNSPEPARDTQVAGKVVTAPTTSTTIELSPATSIPGLTDTLVPATVTTTTPAGSTVIAGGLAATTVTTATTVAAPSPTSTVPASPAPSGKAQQDAAMRSWISRNQIRVIDLSAQISKVSFDSAEIVGACQGMTTAIEAIEMPVPVPEIDNPLRSALASFREAATTCVDGVTNADGAAIQRSGELITQGASYITLATNAVNLWRDTAI